MENISLYQRFTRTMAANSFDYAEVRRLLQEQLKQSAKTESAAMDKLSLVRRKRDDMIQKITALHNTLRGLLAVSEGNLKSLVDSCCDSQVEELSIIGQLSDKDVGLIKSTLDFLETKDTIMSATEAHDRWVDYSHQISTMFTNADERRDFSQLRLLGLLDFFPNDLFEKTKELLSSGVMGYVKKGQLMPNQLLLETTTSSNDLAEFRIRANGAAIDQCVDQQFLEVEVTLDGNSHVHTDTSEQSDEGNILGIVLRFDTVQEGNYVVSALLYGEHVGGSPYEFQKLPAPVDVDPMDDGCSEGLSPIAESEFDSGVGPSQSRPMRPESVMNLNTMSDRFNRTVEIRSPSVVNGNDSAGTNGMVQYPLFPPMPLPLPLCFPPPPPPHVPLRLPHSRPSALFPSPLTRTIKVVDRSKERRAHPKIEAEQPESELNHFQRWLKPDRRRRDDGENSLVTHCGRDIVDYNDFEGDAAGTGHLFKRPRRISQFDDEVAFADVDSPRRSSSDSDSNISTERPDITRFFYRDDSDKLRIDADIVLTLGTEEGIGPEIGEVERSLFKPIGCTKNDHTNDFVVCDTDHQVVKLFDASSGSLKRIVGRGRGMKRPSAVVVCYDQSCIVSKDNQSLRVFSYSGDPAGHMTIGRRQDKYCRLFGLARDPTGKLLTLEVVNERQIDYEQNIVTFDLRKGDTPYSRHRYEGVEPENKDASKLRFLDVHKDRLIVSDLGAHLMYISNLKGLKQREFGGLAKSSQPGKMKEPSGVWVDSLGNILAGDSRNDRVQIFDSEGQFLTRLMFYRSEEGNPNNRKPESLSRPSDIFVTSDNHMMVSNLNANYVSIFKFREP